ncbi:MAG TPA: sigma-70 family RNA polymerase sigma factor [Myxococcaceae bacterium]|nr:sigma-70 family RNA polymerase sigma factor [Myxococcaceae bacterium]
MSASAPKRLTDEHRAPERGRPRRQAPVSLEDVLLKRLRGGDSVAQAELFRRHRDSLRRQALKVIGNPALAEEIVQEGWINGMEALHTFKGRSSFATWMTAIVINEAKVRRRREARVLPFSGLSRQERGGIRSGRETARSAWLETMRGVNDETPERLLLEKEVSSHLQEALRSLSPTQRSVVVLRDFRGASPAQTCETLRMSDQAQRIHLCRGRARIRQALESTMKEVGLE